MAPVVKNPPADAGHEGLIPGSGRSPAEGKGTHTSIPAWKLPRTWEPGGLQSRGFKESDRTEPDPFPLGRASGHLSSLFLLSSVTSPQAPAGTSPCFGQDGFKICPINPLLLQTQASWGLGLLCVWGKNEPAALTVFAQ